MRVIPVGRLEITAAGGASQALTINEKLCRQYFVSFRSTGVTPLAGTTAVSAKPAGGDTVTLKDSGGANVNVDPTAPYGFRIQFPLDTLYFTPSSWTASSKLVCEVFGELE